MIIKILKVTILLALAYLVFKDIDYTKLLDAALSYHWGWLIFCIIFFNFTSYTALSYRWHLLTGQACRIRYCFEAIVVAEFFNNILPARFGEFAKVAYLKLLYNYTISNGLSILIVERFFDLFMLASVGIIVVNFFVVDPVLNIVFYTLIGFIWFMFFLLRKRSRYIIFFVKHMPVRIVRVYGMKVVRNINRIISNRTLMITLLVTLLLWSSYALGYCVFLRYVAGFGLSATQMIVVFVVSAVGMAIPLAPAGTGTFHAAYIMSLGWFGIAKEEALMAALLSHFVQIFPPVILAAFVLYSKSIPINTFLPKKVG